MHEFLKHCSLSTLHIMSKAQDCLRANSRDSLPRFQNPGGSAARIEVNLIQIIIKSYEFHCCGKIGGWSAFLEASDGEVYSIKFQIWRPMSSNRFVKLERTLFLYLPSLEIVIPTVATKKYQTTVSNLTSNQEMWLDTILNRMVALM